MAFSLLENLGCCAWGQLLAKGKVGGKELNLKKGRERMKKRTDAAAETAFRLQAARRSEGRGR